MTYHITEQLNCSTFGYSLTLACDDELREVGGSLFRRHYASDLKARVVRGGVIWRFAGQMQFKNSQYTKSW